MTEAYLANVRTVEVLASLISEMEAPPHLVQISTDHIYSGTGPHSESPVMPMNAYALTKLAGELIALQAKATVLRTNFFGRSNTGHRVSFTDWLYNSLTSGHSFTIFDDVLFSALNMETLADCISKVIQSTRTGVFNVGSRNGLSKARFAVIFAEHLGLNISAMKVGSLRDAQLAAPRPYDMRMDISAFEAEFGLRMPDMAEQIFDAAERYRSKTC
jgi:dTDP-4-dehydrorhamnose reductase